MPPQTQSGTIPIPEASPRAGGYKPGDEITAGDRTFKVRSVKPDGTPVFDMMPKAGVPGSIMQATPQKKEKYTVDELASIYKRQNPQFKGVEDIALVNRILKDHPDTFKRLDLGKAGAQVKWTGTTPQITLLGQRGNENVRGLLEGMAGKYEERNQAMAGFEKSLETDEMMRNVMKDIGPMAIFPALSRLGAFKGALGAAATGAVSGQIGESIDKATGGDVVDPESSWLSRRAQDALWGAGTEFGGRLAGSALRGAAKPLRFALGGTLQDTPPLSRENISSKYGIHFSPSQVYAEQSDITGRPIGMIASGEESRATHNPYSKRIVVTGAKERAKKAFGVVSELVDQLGPNLPENVSGKQIAGAIEHVGKPAYDRQAEELRKVVTAKAFRTQVDVTTLKQEASEELDQIGKQLIERGQYDSMALPDGSVSITPRFPASAKIKMLREVAGFPDFMPFNTLAAKRTEWMGVSPQMTELISGEAKGTAKHYTVLSTKLLDEAAKAPGRPVPDTEFLHQAMREVAPNKGFGDLTKEERTNVLQRAQQLKSRSTSFGREPFVHDWNRFRNFTRKGADVFDSKIIVDAVNKNPEEVVHLLKGGNVTDALRVRRAIKSYAEHYGDTLENRARAMRAWRKFQVSYLRDNVIGTIDGDMTRLAGALDNLDPGLKRVIFDDAPAKATLSRLSEIATAMRDADKNIGVLMGHQDPLSGLRVPTSGQDLEANTKGMLRSIRPYMVAKIAWNPTATRFYLRGIKGLAENPPKDSNLQKWIDGHVLGEPIRRTTAATARKALSIGGVMTNRRLGAAMADILRAYDIVNIYDEAKAEEERAKTYMKLGQQGKEGEPSTPVPAAKPQ